MKGLSEDSWGAGWHSNCAHSEYRPEVLLHKAICVLQLGIGCNEHLSMKSLHSKFTHNIIFSLSWFAEQS
jgi:hypothetical protein